MIQEYNLDGTRNRAYRPYIAFEETTYETNLYDPFRSVNFGLYDRAVPPPALFQKQDVARYGNLLEEINPLTNIGSYYHSPCQNKYPTPSSIGQHPAGFDGQYSPFSKFAIGNTTYGYNGSNMHNGGVERQGMYKKLYAT
jgi:hypothetical protein